jgi:hypothetical protein
MRSLTIALAVVLTTSVLAQEARPRRVEVTQAYDSLTSLDATERRAKLRTVSTDMRAELWIVHLENFLATHADLTPEQRSLVFEAVGMMHTRTLAFTPVDAKLDTPSNRALFDFQRRAHLAFDRELYRDAFVLVGPAQIKMPGRVTMKVRSNGVDCDCQTMDDTCPIFSEGCQTWTACDWTPDGCGTFGQYWCNGLCW